MYSQRHMKTLLRYHFIEKNEFIYPQTATFLVPAKYFNQKITGEMLTQRAGEVLKKMDDPAACQEIEIGDPKEYSWLEWEDKMVIQVKLDFWIGC